MERVEKKSLVQTLSASTTAMPSTMEAAAAQPLTVLADLCFDLLCSEKDCADTTDFSTPIAKQLRRRSDQCLGIVGKCQLPGCDVHYLTRELEIISHLETDASIVAGFQNARDYWQSPHDGAVAVVVYSDRLEAVLMDGSVLVVKN